MIALPAPVRYLLVLLALAASVWVRCLPLALHGAEEQGRDAYRYRGDDGREHVYLADYDSYVWLRHAQNQLATGRTCDAVVDGSCRDLLANAPVGAEMRYADSLHVAALVALHRLVTLFDPDHPLPATAFLVPVIVGTLGMLPAFAIGRMLAGDVGGTVGAVVATLSPIALARSVGSDNDVWNVTLPLFVVWAAMRALLARRPLGQVAWAALAGLIMGLQAAAWRGWTFLYTVTLIGLAAVVLTRATRALLRAPGTRTLGGAVRTLAAFYVATGLAMAFLVPDIDYVGAPASIFGELRWFWTSPATIEPAMPWPSTLDHVAELERPGRETIAITMGGPLMVFAGTLGLLALLLPPRDWRWWHFLTLIGGNFLYAHLITGPEVSRERLVVLLALPLVVATLVDLTADRERGDASDPTAGGRLLIAVWLLGTLLLAYSAARFVLLLSVPFGIAVGVSAGRLCAWMAGLSERLPERAAAGARLLAAAVVLLGLAQPLQRAQRMMASSLPEMHDAWWDTLRELRERTPAEAIVTTWWDYGHWVKYVAERRTTADGGTLLTHVPHWIARALRAPDDRESRGILRMLACGSEATPEPEGRLGAFGKLTARGIDGPEAYRLIAALAVLEREREPARALLAEHGLDAKAQEDVLASTHCAPPPTYLILTTEQTARTAWLEIGRWRPPGGTEGEERAPSARPFQRRAWLPCLADDTPEGRRCPITGFAAEDVLDAAFVYERGAPERGRVVTEAEGPDGERQREEFTPGVLLIAAGGSVMEHDDPSGDPDLAALVEPARDRALLGTPEALRSTFTRLVFLDPDYADRFARVSEHTLYDGTRVVAWRVEW